MSRKTDVFPNKGEYKVHLLHKHEGQMKTQSLKEDDIYSINSEFVTPNDTYRHHQSDNSVTREKAQFKAMKVSPNNKLVA